MIQHVIDKEWVFSYRALCFARNDKISLPSFDQDLFVNNDKVNKRDYDELLGGMSILRQSTIQL